MNPTELLGLLSLERLDSNLFCGQNQDIGAVAVFGAQVLGQALVAAGALSEIGLPQQAIPPALVFFNVGVELGQLLFVATVLLLFWILRVKQSALYERA